MVDASCARILKLLEQTSKLNPYHSDFKKHSNWVAFLTQNQAD